VSAFAWLRIPAALVTLAIVCGCRDDRPGPTASASQEAVPLALSMQSSSEDGFVGNGKPRAEDLAASITLTHVKGRIRHCAGGNATSYAEDEFHFIGYSTGDSRLSGRVDINVRDLASDETYIGPQTGSIVIRDRPNGREKFRGEWTAWGYAGGDFVLGTLVGVATGPMGGKVVAAWTGIYDVGFRAEIGGAPRTSQLPAGIYSGRCPENTPWEAVDRDVPLSSLTGASVLGAKRGRTF
jgi:hypothetical protein